MTPAAPSQPPNTSERLLRLGEVRSRVGLSRAWVYALIKRGDFPRAVQLGERARAWRESDVAAWIASRPTTQ